MRKQALVLAAAATLVAAAVANPSPAHARYYGYGPGIFAAVVAGALIAGIASSAYASGPGYGYYGGYYPGYGYYPGAYGGYYPSYYGGCYPRYYRSYGCRRPYYGYRRAYYGYRHVYAPRYVYGGHRYYGVRYRGFDRWY